MTVPGGWLPLTGLLWIPYAFGSVSFVASPSFLGSITQAYLLLMSLKIFHILLIGITFLFIDPQLENQDMTNIDTHGNKVYPEFPI